MRLLIAICLLAAGCSKLKPLEPVAGDITCREVDTRNCADKIITGDAFTRTPGSPAVTGGRNIITYNGDKLENFQSTAVETASKQLSNSIADLRKHVLHNAEGSRLITDCIRQTAEEWDAQHCEARKKDWLRKERELEMEDKKP